MKQLVRQNFAENTLPDFFSKRTSTFVFYVEHFLPSDPQISDDPSLDQLPSILILVLYT